MNDLKQLLDEIDSMTDAEVAKARDEAIRMARHNVLVAEAAIAVLARRGQGMPKLAETLKVVRRVGALQ